MLFSYNFSYFEAISSGLILWIGTMLTIYMRRCWTLKIQLTNYNKEWSIQDKWAAYASRNFSRLLFSTSPLVDSGFLCPSALSAKRPKERRRHDGARQRRREEEADPAGEGRQMEIDGGRDWEIKRNTPLGVTEEGVRVRGMRGLQAWEGKKWSLEIFLHLSSSPSMVSPCETSACGRGDQFLSSLSTPPGVCYCWCWVCTLCLAFCCGRQDKTIQQER